MPLYEYRCEQCRELIEVLQRYSDDPLTVCEKCGGDLRRLISAPAVQFKGSGWYVTDYADKGKGKGATGDKGASSDGGASAESGGGSPSKDSGDKSAKESSKGSSTKESSGSSGGSSSGSSDAKKSS